MDTQYLKKRGQAWSVIVAVPLRLQAAAGRREFVKSLGTRDLTEANRRKHYWVAEFKRRIAQLRQHGVDPDREVFELAIRFRDALDRSRGRYSESPRHGTVSEEEEVLSEMLDHAKDIAAEDPKAAERFQRAASGKATFIRDIWPTWLDEGDQTEKTKEDYRHSLRLFLEWASERISFEEVDKRLAGQFVTHLAQQGLAKLTVRKKLTALQSLWRWAVRRGIVKANPWHDMGVKAVVKHERKALTTQQVVKLLKAPTPPLISSLIRIGLLTGARLGELCNVKHVRREDGLWLVIEKGKTEAAAREVPVHPLIEQDVKTLPTGLIRANVSRNYSYHRQRAGVTDKRADFHALRSTFIAMMEGEGVPESTVKLLVGHKRSSMTYGYYSKGERVNLREAIDRVWYPDEVMELLNASPVSPEPS